MFSFSITIVILVSIIVICYVQFINILFRFFFCFVLSIYLPFLYSFVRKSLFSCFIPTDQHYFQPD